MVDLSQASEGHLGDGTWFSSILLEAIRTGFTGGVLVQTVAGHATVFFRNGEPLHASGQGFTDHFLGQLLIDRALCRPDQVEIAVNEQRNQQGRAPLLGALLVRDGVDPSEIKRAVQSQTHARLGTLVHLSGGAWRSAPGEDPRVREVGVPLDGWATFFDLMQTQAPSAELKFQADALLGSAVRLSNKGTLPQRTWTPKERKLLNYLQKPRKPDQLERALNSRPMVRGFLRTLALLDHIDILPASKAIPIPKTTKIYTAMSPMTGSVGHGSVDVGSTTTDVNSNLRDVIYPNGRPKQPPHPIVGEINDFHGSMNDKNHFELFGVGENVELGDLRTQFRNLHKKYHTDALPSEIDRSGPVAVKAEEIAARLNQAWEILSNDEKREEYVMMLHDKRIQGDYRKAEKIRDAEMKSKMGVVHLNKREYGKAREMFRIAHENDPSSGLYQAHLAWSLFKDPKKTSPHVIEDVHKSLLDALDKDREQPLIHLYIGHVLKAKNKPRDALTHFKNVLKYSPRHPEANTEVRYLQKRIEREEANNKRSGLARFFGFGDKK